jgi:hypothetical protein
MVLFRHTDQNTMLFELINILITTILKTPVGMVLTHTMLSGGAEQD